MSATDHRRKIEMTRLKASLEMMVVIVAVHVIVACSSMDPKETRRWQPVTIADFNSVAGKWEGLLVRNPRTRDDDWVTVVISNTGAYEFASYREIGVFAGKGKLVLADGKLSAKSEKGGQLTMQLLADSGSPDRILRTEAKDSEGFHYWADLKRAGGAPSAPRAEIVP
jgi:hypothetical protein